MSIRAVIADPAAPEGLRLAEVGEPRPGPEQVIVEAHHVSLNRGDLARVSAGTVLGRDVAGVVVRAAASKTGPGVGQRVVGLANGAFAKRIAVDVDALAEVPEEVDLAEAATLPVAGVAAIQALRAAGLETPIKGARVLITGAAGGVGRFAVQLAAYGGGQVIAVTSGAARAGELASLGAETVVTDPTEVGEPVDLVLDSVGGRQLVAAWQLLTPGGNVQCIGWSSGEPATFPPHSMVGAGRSLSSFSITAPVGPDLASLVRLLHEGSLSVHIGWRGPLAKVTDAAQALRQRRLTGKAVLDLLPGRRR